MKWKFLPIVFLLSLLLQNAFSQVLTNTLSAKKAYTLPFQLTEFNNIILKAVLNRTDTVNLMFHTAATSLTLTETASKQLKTIQFKDEKDSVKSWGSQSNVSRFSESNTLQIGDLLWDKVPIWENTNTAQHADGKFGIDLFKGMVIDINFEKSYIKISKETPKDIKEYVSFPLVIKDGLYFIDGHCIFNGQVLTNQFLIHSGYAGAILFDDVFANKSQLSKQLQIVGEKNLKDSYGNTVKTIQAVLPAFNINATELKNVPAGFFEGTIGRQRYSVMGGDLLKRYNWIIDAKNQLVYLKSNSLAFAPYTKL